MPEQIDPKVEAVWLKLTTPEVLSSNLIRAALFLVAWELLKGSLIDRLRRFFATEFRDGVWQVSDAYKAEVLALDKDKLTASSLWFKNMEALTDDDIQTLREARRYRNSIAHDLPQLLGSFDRESQTDQLTKVKELLVKVDRWWIRNVEIATDPNYVGKYIPDDEISSGSMLMLGLIFDVLKGDHSYRDFLEKSSDEAAANPTPSADG